MTNQRERLVEFEGHIVRIPKNRDVPYFNEFADGFQVYRENGGLLGYLLRSQGWTTDLVARLVDLLADYKDKSKTTL